jgi:thioredoxin reductase
MTTMHEVVIIGGGPAGLSAALIAGRARRRALIIDGGTPRNGAAPAMHSFLSRDGILPRDFRALCHAELRQYETIERQDGVVSAVRPDTGGFSIEFGQHRAHAAKVLLAQGLVDTLPDIAGLAVNWGKGVHHCPFCDGFEHRDQAWGVLADQPALLEHALFLRGWCRSMTIYPTIEVPDDRREALTRAGIRIETRAIRRVLDGDGHSIGGLELADGSVDRIESLWIKPAQAQTTLVRGLGLALREDGAIQRNEMGETAIPGLYAAGDCAVGQMQQAILAAADGARTMFPIVRGLMVAG